MERRTRQRDAILAALEAAGAPLDPRDILRAANRLKKGLGIATVYRAIKSLLKEKRVSAVDLPGASTRYELAGKAHHHHFECSRCGKVYEIDGCLKNIDRLAPPGTRVDRHELILYGRCRRCAG